MKYIEELWSYLLGILKLDILEHNIDTHNIRKHKVFLTKSNVATIENILRINPKIPVHVLVNDFKVSTAVIYKVRRGTHKYSRKRDD